MYEDDDYQYFPEEEDIESIEDEDGHTPECCVPVELDDAQQNSIVGDAVQEWIRFTTQIWNLREQSRENWQHYLSNRPEFTGNERLNDTDRTSANIRSGEIAKAVDGIRAQQHIATFPQQESYFDIKHLNTFSKDYNDLYMKTIMDRQNDKQFLEATFKDRLNLILDGTAAVWHPFKRETKLFPAYEPVTIRGSQVPGKFKKKMIERTTCEYTDFIPLQFEDWRIDPGVARWDQTPFLWRRWVHPQEIKNMKDFQNKDEVKTYQEFWDDQGLRTSKFQYIGIDKLDSQQEDLLADNKMGAKFAWLTERWGDFWIDDEFYPNHILVFSNNSTFHYFGPNPYDHAERPFSVVPYISLPHTLYGKSNVSDAIPMANVGDTLWCQTVDILSNCGNPAYTGLTTDVALMEYLGDKDDGIVPGEVIPVQMHDSLRPLMPALQNLTVISQLVPLIIESIRDLTGGVPYATGNTGQTQDRTLGEVQILSAATSTKYQPIIQNYENNRLEPYLRQYIWNDRQFVSEPIYVSDGVEPITPSILKQCDFRVTITGSRSVLGKAREIQDLDAIMGQMLPALFQAGFAVPKKEVIEIDVAALVKRAAQLKNVPDIDETFKVVESEDNAAGFEGSNPMAAQQAAMQQQMGGGNALQRLPQALPSPQGGAVA